MEKLLTVSRELIVEARLWSVERINTARILRELADDILKHHFNVNVAKIAGSSSAIGGFALIVTGFASALFTFGSSAMILSSVGGVLSAGCGKQPLVLVLRKGRLLKRSLQLPKKP